MYEILVGFCKVDVAPLPKSQFQLVIAYEAVGILVSKKSTRIGAQPLSGFAKKLVCQLFYQNIIRLDNHCRTANV